MSRVATAHDFHPTRSTEFNLERALCLAAGGLLLAYGARGRGISASGLMVAAAPLIYRAVADEWPLASATRSDDTRVALSGDRGLHVHDAVRLEKPIEEVYRFWRHLENLPRFMAHLEEVTQQDATHSHWVAVGPGGLRYEWDAEIINEVENELIAWRSLPGADVVSAGSVRFARMRDGRSTQVTVHLQYAPPAGRAGAMLSKLFGREPSQTVREDLRRLKQTLEAGELADNGNPPNAGDRR